MSEQSGGAGWWQASDGKWYPPQAPAQPQLQQPPQFPQSPAPGAPANSGMATASLVLGIVGICTFWTCWLGLILGVLAIIFGQITISKERQVPGSTVLGRAKAGLITGGVAVGLSLLVILAVFALNFLGESAEQKFEPINTDPSDGVCDTDRYLQDPDC